ncbi:MAG: sugar ABC transporter substrate-binding protein [Okeania sp. SIO3B5]|uniref:sugar ABC transporter substrate-binding protein n=1 Tax=Okeania sp. SIO3B5 TaxID=2607811 RepID=UPI0014007D7E|nr:sugar ABC transporter substrate-binding protein [Okeania sp. SIO3B5]NEO57616.1 sugar ABC transporter substrate-binding protein [Okeania sp. SIO3B5]
MKPKYITLIIITFGLLLGISLLGKNQVSLQGNKELPPSQRKLWSDSSHRQIYPRTIQLIPQIQATKPWKIVFVSKDGLKGHQFHHPGNCRNSSWCSIWENAKQFGDSAGVKIELAYVHQNCAGIDECISTQVRLIDDLIAQDNIDGMIVGPRDSNLLVPVIEKAISNKIPVVIIDTPLNTTKTLTQVLVSDRKLGEEIGNWVVQQLKGEGKVLIINGPKNQYNASERKKGILSGLQTGNITILDIEETDWTKPEAKAIAKKWLKQFSDIDAIITVSGNLALGVLEEIKAQKREGILITSFDNYPEVKNAIVTGDISTTADSGLNSQGSLAVKVLVEYLENNQSFPSIVYAPKLELLTAEQLIQFHGSQKSKVKNQK